MTEVADVEGDELITLSRSALRRAIKAELLDSFADPREGEPFLSEYEAFCIAENALRRASSSEEIVPGGVVVYETQESENGRRIVGHYLQMPDGSRTVLTQFPAGASA